MVVIASHPGYLIIGRLDKLNDVHHSGDKRTVENIKCSFQKAPMSSSITAAMKGSTAYVEVPSGSFK